jgi:2-oxoisovalerate dehydrogenase E1 component
VPGTEDAKTIEPSKDYILPLGKANIVVAASAEKIKRGETVCVITYGMGVYWAKAAAEKLANLHNDCKDAIEIVDLRTLYPLDEELVFNSVRKHGKVLVLTEEPLNNSFAEALSLRISNYCYHFLDAKVEVMGALNLPAVPINLTLEAAMLPTANKVTERLEKLLKY